MQGKATQNASAFVSTRYCEVLCLPYTDLHRSHMSSIVKLINNKHGEKGDRHLNRCRAVAYLTVGRGANRPTGKLNAKSGPHWACVRF